MEACLTPDQKVACSNHVGVTNFFSFPLSHFLLISNHNFFVFVFFVGLLLLIVPQVCPVRNISAAETVPRLPLVFLLLFSFHLVYSMHQRKKTSVTPATFVSVNVTAGHGCHNCAS